MANITEISDSSKPMPSVAEMRESQRKGSVGTGTQDGTYGEQESDFNMGTGE